MCIGKSGAKNAAFLATQILALAANDLLAIALKTQREQQIEALTEKNQQLQAGFADQPTMASSILTAIQTLKHGGIIAYPTEAVWGLGCDPFNEDAVTIETLKTAASTPRLYSG